MRATVDQGESDNRQARFMNRRKCRQVLDCGDEAQRSRRFGSGHDTSGRQPAWSQAEAKAVTSQTPSPHSKALARAQEFKVPKRHLYQSELYETLHE